MITTTSLNHLALPAADPQRSARFYTGLFNMEIISSSPDAAFLKTIGSTDMLVFSRAETPIRSDRDGMHFGFIVTPEQFDAALQVIEQKKVKKASEPSKRSIGRYIFIEDPDGYKIELFECISPLYSSTT